MFTFFGGKGGVGKTTCSAAYALSAAGRGARVLVVSTDPAHSLGDALNLRLSARATRVRGRLRGSLHAVELDAPRALARWLDRHRRALGDIVEHGTWLDRHDVEAMLDLPVPGVDELVGMLEIADLAEPYDEVVVDTAPTGHTLRLLNAPDTVAAVAEVLDSLQEEHRFIRRRFARDARPEAADRFIELVAEQARDTGALLRDPARTRFEWVLLAEELSIAESADGLRALARAHVPVPDVIVNHVLPPGPACPICDRRRADEARAIARIRRTIAVGRHLRIVPAELDEPRGVPALMKIGALLTASARSSAPARLRRNVRVGAPAAMSRGTSAGVSAESIPAFRGARLLFFGGKGGVGKTTVSAAAAIRLAKAHPRAAVLLLSTDPAHSLADVLDAPVGDRASRVRGAPRNLFVRELDAPAALAARRAGLEEALADIMVTFGGERTGAAAADTVVRQLMDLAPPGIDELFGMLTVVEAQRDYPLIVIDTAPTGHTLRLLEMPEAAREWVQVLLRMLLKYGSVVRPGRFAAELVELSKTIRTLQDLMHDRAATRFIVVTRATEVTRLETERLLGDLRTLKLATPAIVVNALTLGPGTCRRCRATTEIERNRLRPLRSRRRDCVIIQTPLTAPPPRGVAALERWARTWITS